MLRARLAGKPVKAVYSSDLERCLAGARMLGEAFELQPVAKPDLRELHIGDWEGKTWSELQATHPQEWQARLDDIVHYRVPNGENLLDLADRVRPRIREIIIRHHGEEVIVVAHGGVNRVILLDAIGAPLSQLFHLEQDFGCLNIIDYYADGVSVVKMLNG
jgi:alpha-ribazole phosphatase/probable phosphoglycerate mutase